MPSGGSVVPRTVGLTAETKTRRRSDDTGRRRPGSIAPGRVRADRDPRATAATGVARPVPESLRCRSARRRRVLSAEPAPARLTARLARESDRGWQRRTSRSTAPSRSPFSRVWRRSASGPVCTSARPASGVCTTWCGRSWTTRSTRRWPVTATPSTWCCSPTAASGSSTTAVAFPVDLHPKLKKPGVEVALTVLHAGGKFDGKAYAVSGGLHGVGVSVVNALSTRMEVEIHKDGYVWRQTYTNSKPAPLEKGEPTDRNRHRRVTFWPDPDDLRDHRLRLRDDLPPAAGDGLPQPRPHHRAARRAGRRGARTASRSEVTFCYKGGIADFVRHLNRPRAPIHKSVVEFGAEGEGMSVEIAMQWNESYGESVYTFANTINTHEGGTHEEGFRAALTSVVNKYGADKKLLKGDEKLSGEDIREGLAAIISVKLANPQFEGQTKTKLGNTDGEELRAEGLQRVAGRLVRAQPGRGQDDHHEGVPGGPGPDRRRAGAQAGPAQVAAGVRLDAGQAGRLPVDRPARVASCSSSRATRPAARPSRAATRGPRRSCRSAARSSTWRRPASTGC